MYFIIILIDKIRKHRSNKKSRFRKILFEMNLFIFSYKKRLKIPKIHFKLFSLYINYQLENKKSR